MKPLAPARSASTMYSSNPKVVSTRIRWRGMRRVASIPSMPGIRMSIRITSGSLRLGRGDRRGAVAGLADDLDRPVASSTALKPLHERLIVGDQDAQARHGGTAPPCG